MRPLLLPLLALLLAACAHHPPAGPISASMLRSAAPQFARVEPVDPAELSRLRAALSDRGPAQLTVYFGDWCGDSIREVPRLLALIDALPAEQLTVSLYNLDRDKADPAGRATADRIERIPTIIVSRDGQELGRIVEQPQQTVGADLADLLAGANAP